MRGSLGMLAGSPAGTQPEARSSPEVRRASTASHTGSALRSTQRRWGFYLGRGRMRAHPPGVLALRGHRRGAIFPGQLIWLSPG